MQEGKSEDDSSHKRFFEQALKRGGQNQAVGSVGSNQGLNVVFNSKVEDHFKNSNLTYVMRRSTYRHQRDDQRTTSWGPKGSSFHNKLNQMDEPLAQKDSGRTQTVQYD